MHSQEKPELFLKCIFLKRCSKTTLLGPCHCTRMRTNAWVIFPVNHLDPRIPVDCVAPIFCFWIKFLFLKHSPLLNFCLIFGLPLSCILWVFCTSSPPIIAANHWLIHWGYYFSWLFSTPIFLVLIAMAVFMRMLYRRASKILLKSTSFTAPNSHWTTRLGIQSEEIRTWS